MAQPKTADCLCAPDAYLAGEREARYRHEFVAGRIYAMAGASEAHNIIALNLASALNAHVAEACRVFVADMKLHTRDAAGDRYYYPDVFVACQPANREQHVRDDACLIVEVLSPSTERLDRFEKFYAYMTLPTLEEYVLIDQSTPQVEIHRRRTGWQREAYGLDDTVTLDSVGLSIAVRQIYRRIFS